eukprot:jgi/Orpsp1_1/1174243/evm.model.c7180000049384.1
MVVTEASVVTNFCMEGDKCKKSKEGYKNYKIINKMIKKTPNMNVEEVKKTLAAAKNDNTQWSVIYDLKNKEAIYYFQENYDQEYRVKLGGPREIDSTKDDDKDFEIKEVKVTEEIQELIKDSFSVSEFRGDDGIDEFIKSDGCTDEYELFDFVMKYFKYNKTDINNGKRSNKNDMACSDFSVQNEKGNGSYFGRNFDWKECEYLVMVNHPTNGYSSISSVNVDFLRLFLKDKNDKETPIKDIKIPEEIYKPLALYFPLDGMNEKGLSIAINNVPGNWPVQQSFEGRVDATLSPVVRFFDANGKTVVVEYSEDQKMHVKEVSVVTNHYLTIEELMEYNRNGILNDMRYEVLLNRITKKPNQSLKDVRNTLRSSSKHDTEWSIAYDKYNKMATYFRRRDYDIGYQLKIFEDQNDKETHNGDVEDEEITNNDDNEKTVPILIIQ